MIWPQRCLKNGQGTAVQVLGVGMLALSQVNITQKKRRSCDIDVIGARVNGRMRPNGADDRIRYTDIAYKTIIGV